MMSEQGFNESVKSLRSRSGRLEREGDYWSADEKERLEEMFCAGVGISEITIRLHRTEPAVFQQIEKLDLYQRKVCPRRRKLTVRQCGCLCSACEVDPSACPRSRDHAATGEVC